MLDDTTQAQPVQDTTAQPVDPTMTGGVLGTDPVSPVPSTVAPEPDVTAPSADAPPYNTSPVDEVPSVADQPLDKTAPDITSTMPTAEPPASTGSSDLLSLKQQALQSLSPLLGKLDQTPEEKFRTIMMLIQASDDQSLVQSAYDAANQITDEKARAQALLDVVNEINYFTQQPKNNE